MSPLLAAHARRLSFACLAFAMGIALLAVLACRADAAYTVPNFSVSPSTTQAAAHPNLTVSIDPDAAKADLIGDDLKNITIDAPTGMVFDQNAATSKCSSSQLTTDTCPAASTVGSINVKWRTLLGGSVAGTGTVYVTATPAGNSAALGVVLRPTNYKKLSFPIAITNAVPYSAPTRFTATSVPRTIQTSGGLTVAATIDQLDVTLNAKAGAPASGPSFTLNPSACSAATTQATFVSYLSVTVSKSSSFTPTGCGAVPFQASASIQAANPASGSATPTSTIFEVPQGDAAIQQSDLKSFTVDMPNGTKLNAAAANAVTALCSDAKLTTDTCPIGSKIGNAATRTPLWGDPFTGDLYLMTRSATTLGFGMVLRNATVGAKLPLKATQAAVDANADGTVDFVRQTVTNIPQIPWSAWYLNVNSPLVTNPTEACASVSATGRLSAWSGSSATVVSPWYASASDCNPDATITSAPSGSTANTSPSISFTGSTANLTFQCQWDNGPWTTCASPVQPPAPLPDGAHKFCVRAVSGPFVDQTPACAQFTVDTTAPTVTITQFGISNGTAQGAFFVNDPTASVNCRIDTTNYPNCTSPFTATGISGGSHTFMVCATDPAGNQGCAFLVLDVSPVNVTITSGPTGAVGTLPVTFAFTSDAPAGANETYRCNLDGNAYAACTSPISYTGLSTGTHTFCVYGVDAFGNESNVACRTFTYDNTPPAPPTVVRSAPLISPTNATNAVITATANSGGTLQGSLDGAAFANIASPVFLSGLADGAHVYSVREVSAAGVAGPTASVGWTVDTVAPAPPVVVRTNPTANPTGIANQAIAVTPAEAGGTLQGSLDGAAFAPITSPVQLTGLAFGVHTYSARQVDAAGNVGSVSSVTWTVAIVDPFVTITSSPPNLTNSKTANFAFTGAPSGSIYQCQLDSGAWTSCVSPVTYSALAEGAHTFCVRAVTLEGIIGPSACKSFTVDTVPPPMPTLTRTSPASSPSTQTTATFVFSDTEPGVTFQASRDGGAFTQVVSPTTISGLGDGAHTYQLRAMDTAGNISPAVTNVWTVASEPPPPPTPTCNVNGRTLTCTWGTVPTGYTVTCALDSSPSAACTSPVAYSGLADGSHTWRFCVVDQAGNVSCTTYNFTIQATAVVTITAAPPAQSSSTSATFSFVSSVAPSTFECQLDGAAFAPCASPTTYSQLPDGVHTFCVRGRDALGTLSSNTPCYSWSSGGPLTPPTLTRISPATSPSSSSSATFSVTGAPAGSVLQRSLDGGAFSTFTSPLSLTGLADGSHLLSVRYVTAEGDTSSTVSNSWVVDTVPPPAPVVTGPSSPSPQTTATLTFSDSEAGVMFQCSLDGSAYSACVSPMAYSALAYATHTFSVRATDVAGNVSAPGTYTWLVSAEEFSVSIDSGPNSSTLSTTATFSFSSNIPGTTFTCQLDGLGFSACTSPITYSGLAQGAHTFCVRGSNGGNVQQACRSWTVQVATPPGPPPVVQITSPADGFTTDQSSVDVTYTVATSDGQSATCDSPSPSTRALVMGPNAITVTCSDSWSQSTTAAITVTRVVNSNPIVTIASPQQNFKTQNTSILLSYVATPAGTTCTPDNNTQLPLALGANTITVNCTGPDGAVATASVSGQRAAPLTLNPGCTVVGTTTAQFSCFPTASGGFPPYTFTCRYDNGAQTNCSSYVSPLMTIGAHVVTICVTDSIGTTVCLSYTYTYSGGGGGGGGFPTCPPGMVCTTSTDP